MKKFIAFFIFATIVSVTCPTKGIALNDLSSLIRDIGFEQKSDGYREILQPTETNLTKCRISGRELPANVFERSINWVQRIVNKTWLIDDVKQDAVGYKDLIKWELPYPGGGIDRQVGDYIYYNYSINGNRVRIEENGIRMSICITFLSPVDLTNSQSEIMQWATNVLNIPLAEITNMSCQVNRKEMLVYGAIRKTKDLHPELTLLTGVPLAWAHKDFEDLNGLITILRAGKTPLSLHIWQNLSVEARELLTKYDEQIPGGARATQVRNVMIRDLNGLRVSPDHATSEQFNEMSLTNGVGALVYLNLQGDDLVRLNRLLLESAYPDLIKSRREHDIRINDYKWWWHEIVFITDGKFTYFNVKERDGSPIYPRRKPGLPDRF